MSSTAGAFVQPRAPDIAAHVRRHLVVAAAYTALSLLVALAVLLLLRRLSGAFHQPLSGPGIISAAALLALVAFGLRQLFREPALQSSALNTPHSVLSTRYMRWPIEKHIPFRLTAADLLITFSVLAIALALSIRGTPLWGLCLAWLMIIAAEVAPRLARFRIPPSAPLDSPALTAQPSTPIAVDDEINEPEIAEPEIPPGLIQQLTRVVADGRESIHALLKADIAPLDRLAVVHIAFCPPLSDQPELSAHAPDCEDAEIRLTQTESFGARLEVRLPAVSESPRSLLIEILGSAKANQDS